MFRCNSGAWRITFQSTRPARGATSDSLGSVSLTGYISIHAPREGRDLLLIRRLCEMHISIHAPREGRDEIAVMFRVVVCISIHAPREGRDDRGASKAHGGTHFNPRAPRGARQQK